MTYQDTVNWMFQQLPMYQNQGKSAYKANLDNTLHLAKHLQHPEHNFKSIHVAGTNGKGSTSHMLASIFQEAGYKVGLYTSPHLKDFRERIKINGKDISEAFVMKFINSHQNFFETHTLSFFEMTVGMAFEYFSEEKVDIAIIEVGMGGRLDSTNIITPEVSIITNIGLDHTQFLGNTLQAIAFEKGGVIKPHIPVVIGETQYETENVFKELADARHAEIYFADQQENEKSYVSDLKGNYQEKNKTTVLLAIKILRKKSFEISEEALKLGFLNVVKNTGLHGRWEILQENPKIICDTAHNKEGLQYAMTQLLNENFERLHLVFGVVNDKDVASIIPLLPKDALYYFCKPNIPRGLEAAVLRDIFSDHGIEGNAYKSVQMALSAAKQHAAASDVIYVGGSTFVVAEII
ncbi:dihydrofolate synthase/folylpolyglutamate synthase [Gelidibacter algens]|uniref:Dihydrofolate synthase/folylpolyglutamate synthase n=1 Tax=Gelidibacter algens TaxID=49280 RepID=A0A1A7R0V0_9FLAO|nr:folylpolyglutamate synthase/dihydrofolate synthase family protein [Gelidibacter algens]OBX25148.1 tetrahydrofolate synthase [Gelidibacter algens]RAJ20040.1 dihydrofolate synthase/folylpolyglutamate synthase [Gelidibacter algens]